MSKRRKVVLTGACGTISSLMRDALARRYDLTLLDIQNVDRSGTEVPGVRIVDLTEVNRDAYRAHFEGADAIVHNAFVGQPSFVNRFSAEIKNVQMAYNIYQTALEEGVRRVVMTSSNHAADYYEDLILEGKLDLVTPFDQARSYGFYGWAKDAYEHLGFVFALGRVSDGVQLENVQIRIGGPRETVADQPKLGDLRRLRRGLAVYLSQRDLVQLYVKSIETEDIRDKEGVPFQIFYGISGNTHAFWSIANARKVIGYAPQDNSEHKFANSIRRHLKAAGKIG